MASATFQSGGQNSPTSAPTPAPAITSDCYSLFLVGTYVFEDNDGTAAYNPAPNPVVTINVTDLKAIQPKIADREVAQLNSRCCRRSDFESDHE